MLICVQRPDATHVAGFNAWKKLNRNVRKGEKGIRILAPLIGRSKENPEEGDAAKRLYGFRVVSVFDEAQTDGEAIASYPGATQKPTGGSEALARLEAAASILNVTIADNDDALPAGAEGASYGGKVVLSLALTPTERAGVLAHELAHELLHQGENKEAAKAITKKQRELEAEAVAFAVLSHFGVELASRFYLATYAITGEMLNTSMATISKTARRLIDLCAEEGDSSPSEAVALAA
jgi:antirestriction protein ArdC